MLRCLMDRSCSCVIRCIMQTPLKHIYDGGTPEHSLIVNGEMALFLVGVYVWYKCALVNVRALKHKICI